MRYIVVVLFVLLAIVPVLAQAPIELQCGDIIEGEFTQNYEIQGYSINAVAGDRVDISASVLGNLSMALILSGPTNLLVDLSDQEVISSGSGWLDLESQPAILSPPLSSNQKHILYAINFEQFFWEGVGVRLNNIGESYTDSSGGVGVYTLYIGCTLRDGTVINPGETVDVQAPPNPDAINTTSQVTTVTVQETITQLASDPAFFGFPGVAPVDFSDGIEIPMVLGQPQTTPLSGDLVALYTYDATADSTATLSLSRVSGDVSVGVTVIQRDTNELLFLGGLPSSNNLSVELTFPSDATYVIGLFALATGEQNDTSGAVQVTLE